MKNTLTAIMLRNRKSPIVSETANGRNLAYQMPMKRSWQWLFTGIISILLAGIVPVLSHAVVVGYDSVDKGPINALRGKNAVILGVILHEAQNEYRWEDIVTTNKAGDVELKADRTSFRRILLNGETVKYAGNAAHFFITEDSNGKAKLICIGHPGLRITYHAGSSVFFGSTKGNQNTIGVEYMGYTDEEPPSDSMLAKGKQLLEWLRAGKVPDDSVCDFMRDSYKKDLAVQKSFAISAVDGKMPSDNVKPHCDGASNIYKGKNGKESPKLTAYKKNSCYSDCPSDVKGVIEVGRRPCGNCFLTANIREQMGLEPIVCGEHREIGRVVDGCLVTFHDDAVALFGKCNVYTETCLDIKNNRSVIKAPQLSEKPKNRVQKIDPANFKIVQFKLMPGETVYGYLKKNFPALLKQLDIVLIELPGSAPVAVSNLNGCHQVPAGKDLRLYLPKQHSDGDDKATDEYIAVS